MADSDPTGGGQSVAFTIPTPHKDFLRGAFDICRKGIEGDLATPANMRNPARARREADAFGRLLGALDTDSIVPDGVVVRVLENFLDALDRENEYEQVMLEHRAACGLLGQLTEERAG